MDVSLWYIKIYLSNQASFNPYTFNTLLVWPLVDPRTHPQEKSGSLIYTGIYAIESSDPLDIPLGPIGPPGRPPIDPLWTPKHIPWSQWTIKITCTALQIIRGEDPSIVARYWETSAHSDQVGRYKKYETQFSKLWTWLELSCHLQSCEFAFAFEKL